LQKPAETRAQAQDAAMDRRYNSAHNLATWSVRTRQVRAQRGPTSPTRWSLSLEYRRVPTPCRTSAGRPSPRARTRCTAGHRRESWRTAPQRESRQL